MKLVLFYILLWPAFVWADSVVDTRLRLSNPPAVRLTCLPFSDQVVLEPIEIGPIPAAPEKQQAFLQTAEQSGIYVGLEKVGPFEENEGILHVSCNTPNFKLTAKFTYYNYPTIFDRQGAAISAKGFFEGLNSLNLKSLIVDNIELGGYPDFMNQCSHPQCPDRLVRLIIYPKEKRVLSCFSNKLCKPSHHPK